MEHDEAIDWVMDHLTAAIAAKEQDALADMRDIARGGRALETLGVDPRAIAAWAVRRMGQSV